MKRIYTRSGDRGTTAIHGGERVPKDDARIEANGTLDELNVAVGMVRSLLPAGDDRQPLLRDIQFHLMTVMSLVATPSDRRDANPNSLPEGLVEGIETHIDVLTELCGASDYFILPGGTPLAAWLHQARVTARRAERRLWTLHRQDPLPASILQYVNRLSDLFFVMARAEMTQQSVDEERWKLFAYKRKKE
jgi:ATP:cob(I)alamin adenosyltransferase